MKITIFSTTTCPYCKMLKTYLDGKGMSYTEKLIDQDDQARDEMISISDGFMGVPYTLIEKEGQIEKIIGFDKGKLDNILGLSQ